MGAGARASGGADGVAVVAAAAAVGGEAGAAKTRLGRAGRLPVGAGGDTQLRSASADSNDMKDVRGRLYRNRHSSIQQGCHVTVRRG